MQDQARPWCKIGPFEAPHSLDLLLSVIAARFGKFSLNGPCQELQHSVVGCVPGVFW